MAFKKPLVLTNGQIEQLQSTDTLVTVDLPQFTNANASPIVIGTAVYISASDTVNKARANAVGTVGVIGLVADASIASGSAGGVQVGGILAATTGEWDAVTGGSGGLTPGAIYYLSAATAGMITSTAPSSAGEYVVQIGTATSTTEMMINIERRILL